MLADWRTVYQQAGRGNFPAELPAEHLRIVDRTGLPGGTDGLSDNPAISGEFHSGQLVMHASFGVGRIASISTTASGTRAVVNFNRVGQKTLFLEHANLQPI